MRQRAEVVIRWQRTYISAAGKAETYEMVTVAPPRYWALLWPQNEDVSALFRMATLPVRIIPVALLWATSKPARLLIALTVAVASAVLTVR
jgi:hypothetical protein